MIDCLTVTKRVGWYDLALESLVKQQMDINWVIVDENLPASEEHQMMITHDEYTLMITYLSAPPKKRLSNLNASLNQGLRFCQNDYVVFYQDFIILPKNCLNDLLDFATGMGGKSFIGTVTKNPPDKKEDMRYLGVDCIRPCMPEEWEANVGLAPMQAIYDVGGFEESYDDGWSWDNVNLAERAAMLGYEFYLDEATRPQLLSHEETPPEVPRNGDFHANWMKEIREGTRPIKASYL